MPADPILTLAWLVLAHLVADFVVQTRASSSPRTSRGRRGLAGTPRPRARRRALPRAGRARVRRARPLGPRRHRGHPRGHRPGEGPGHARGRGASARGGPHAGTRVAPPAAGLGRAWTPLPAAYFVADQVAHLAVIVVAWAIWLAGQAPTAEWSDAVEPGSLGSRDQAVVHEVSLVAVVVPVAC